jgi:hypothetical protein
MMIKRRNCFKFDNYDNKAKDKDKAKVINQNWFSDISNMNLKIISKYQ